MSGIHLVSMLILAIPDDGYTVCSNTVYRKKNAPVTLRYVAYTMFTRRTSCTCRLQCHDILSICYLLSTRS